MTPNGAEWTVIVESPCDPCCEAAEYRFANCWPSKLEVVNDGVLAIKMYNRASSEKALFKLTNFKLWKKNWVERTAVVLEPKWLKGAICRPYKGQWLVERLFDINNIEEHACGERDLARETAFIAEAIGETLNSDAIPIVDEATLVSGWEFEWPY